MVVVGDGFMGSTLPALKTLLKATAEFCWHFDVRLSGRIVERLWLDLFGVHGDFRARFLVGK